MKNILVVLKYIDRLLWPSLVIPQESPTPKIVELSLRIMF